MTLWCSVCKSLCQSLWILPPSSTAASIWPSWTAWVVLNSMLSQLMPVPTKRWQPLKSPRAQRNYASNYTHPIRMYLFCPSLVRAASIASSPMLHGRGLPASLSILHCMFALNLYPIWTALHNSLLPRAIFGPCWTVACRLYLLVVLAAYYPPPPRCIPVRISWSLYTPLSCISLRTALQSSTQAVFFYRLHCIRLLAAYSSLWTPPCTRPLAVFPAGFHV